MKRSPELEALLSADESSVRDPDAGRNQLLRLGVLLIGAAVTLYFLFMGGDEPNNRGLGGEEEFRTTEFSPSSFEREAPQPPEPAELPELPPPPVLQEVSSPPEEMFPNRYLSGQLVLDGAPTSEEAEGEGAAAAGTDKNSAFLNAISAQGTRKAMAEQLKRLDALVPEGTMIPGILETAVNSDLPGQVRAVVSSDVYSFDGRRVLIPTGSRLIGEYQADVERGQERVFVVWTRLIRQDGVSVRLNSIGADGIGRAGLTGHVDTKFFERFAAATLLSVISAGASYLIDPGEETSMEFDPGGGGRFSTRSSGGKEGAREAIARSMSAMVENEVRANVNIKPTVGIPQGERIFVYVRQDLDFARLYEDPVTEALEEIQRERGIR